MSTLPYSEYDRIDALNWSTLKLMGISPAYMRHQCDHPEEREDTPAFVSGRAVHCAVLEPDEFKNRYVIQPDFGNMRTKSAREAKAEWLESLPDGTEVITIADRDMAMRCADAVRENKAAAEIMTGAQFEKVVTWETDGVKCKGRIDALTDRVIDLKTTRRNTMDLLERDAATFDYHAQIAWYHDGAVKAGLIGGDVKPAAVFIHAQQKSTFVDVAVLEMSYETLEHGREKYQKLLTRYVGCMASSWWPGMADRAVQWDLPEWKIMRDLDD